MAPRGQPPPVPTPHFLATDHAPPIVAPSSFVLGSASGRSSMTPPTRAATHRPATGKPTQQRPEPPATIHTTGGKDPTRP